MLKAFSCHESGPGFGIWNLEFGIWDCWLELGESNVCYRALVLGYLFLECWYWILAESCNGKLCLPSYSNFLASIEISQTPFFNSSPLNITVYNSYQM